ncbi:MAG: hypothetical protein ACR2N3_07965 [Pyrinomonadaceae bacterium]
MTDEEVKAADDLLERVIKILNPTHRVVQDEMELIVGVLMILLDHPKAGNKVHLFLTDDLTTQVEGKLLDKICGVINKTYLMKGEEATLADDTALEIIRDYLLEHDEFFFYKNQKRILRKPLPKKKKY